jgi:three-Cys-motif partner protein
MDDRSGQTSIFDLVNGVPDEPVVVSAPRPPKLKLVTSDGVQLQMAQGRQSLVHDPDGLYSRVVHPHSRRKASIVSQYAAMVGTGMKFHWPGKRWWVEFYSGPGQLFEAESGEFLPGSPKAALSIKDPFDGYVFVDLDPLCMESLQARVVRMRRDRAGDVFLLQGNANSTDTLDRITSIVPRDALVVMYADPEGLDFHVPTIRHFTDRYRHLDWLINFPGPGVARYLAAGYDERAIRVLGDPDPRRFLADARAGRKVATMREVYQRLLEGLGYRTRSEPIYLPRNGVVIYDVFLATRHDRALDFFDKACGIKLGQGTLFEPGA